jgi:hypothetical protein
MAVRSLPPTVQGRQITILSSNQAALLAVSQPRQQSGQVSVHRIYDAVRKLKERGNSVQSVWMPAQEESGPGKRAKVVARQATERGCVPQAQPYRAKSTTVNSAIAKLQGGRMLPVSVGKYSKSIDVALPGRHTRTLYDTLKRTEACVLAQLRTGMARLNGYLHQIGGVESDLCACGQAKETVKHFLFRCARWDVHRTQMLAQTDTRRGNLSFYVGGKTPSDPETWRPNMNAVRATIRFALDTGRLNTEL